RRAPTAVGAYARRIVFCRGDVLPPHAAARSVRPFAHDGPSPSRQQIFETLCSACHPIEDVTSARKTRAQWRETVDNMIANGATGTDAGLTTALCHVIGEYA